MPVRQPFVAPRRGAPAPAAPRTAPRRAPAPVDDFAGFEEGDDYEEPEPQPQRRTMNRAPSRVPVAPAAPARGRGAPARAPARSAAPQEPDDLDLDDEYEDGDVNLQPAPTGRRGSPNAPDPNELEGTGAPAVKFAEIGDSIKGEIIDKQTMQQRDFITGQPKFWDDGGPMWQVIYTLATNRHDDEEDDGERRLFAKSGVLTAIKLAVKDAGVRNTEIGGILAVKFVSVGTPSRRGNNPPKVFDARYRPPA
jgi:hypothetical protein